MHIDPYLKLVAPGSFVSSFVDTTCLRQEHRRRIDVSFNLLVVIQQLGGGGDPKSLSATRISESVKDTTGLFSRQP